MNNINQLILTAFVLLYGMSVLTPFLKEINSFLIIGLSWFVGWAILGLIEITLIVFGIGVTPFKLLMLSLIFLAILNLYGSRHMEVPGLLHCYKERFNRNLSSKLIMFIGITAFFVYCLNFVFITTDRLVSESLSRIFHDFGTFSDERHRLFDVLLNQRLPLDVSIQNISRLMNVERYTCFSVVTVLSLCAGFIGFWTQQNKPLNKSSKLWLYAVIALILTCNPIISHFFTPLSNIPAMCYYSMGILCLHYYIKKKGAVFFILACFLLGATSLIRKEMLLFAMIPYIVMLWQGIKIKGKHRLCGMLIYILVAFTWFIWGIYQVSGKEIIQNGFKAGAHGGYLITILLIPTTLIVFAVPGSFFKGRVIRLLATIIAMLAFLALVFHKSDQFIVSVKHLFMLMSTDNGRWGFAWAIIAFGLISYLFLSLHFMLRLQSLPSTLIIGINHNSSLTFLWLTIISFILLRILLFTMFTFPHDTYFNSSGNRILMHIYPVILYFLGEFGYLLDNACYDENS